MVSHLLSLVAVVGFADQPAAKDAGSELPAEVQRYLEATEQQASIPVWDNGYKPQVDLLFASLREPIAVGQTGRIDSFKVIQIVDGTNMRADVSWYQPRQYKIVGPKGKTAWRKPTRSA